MVLYYSAELVATYRYGSEGLNVFSFVPIEEPTTTQWIVSKLWSQH